MDIMLNTLFNNPNLPLVPMLGFTDSFDRAAGSSLGTTDDGKAWTYFGLEPWTITADGHASSDGAGTFAVVDALTPNGTLTTTVGREASEGGDYRSGLAMRAVDSSGYVGVYPNTSGTLTLYVRAGNAPVSSQQISGTTLATGDTYSMTMVGTQLTVTYNGSEVLTETVTHHADVTTHGLYATSGSDTEWDSISFDSIA